MHHQTLIDARSPKWSSNLAMTRLAACRSLKAVTFRLGLMSAFYPGRAAPPGAALPSHSWGSKRE